MTIEPGPRAGPLPKSTSNWILIEGNRYRVEPAPRSSFSIVVSKPFSESQTSYPFFLWYRGVGATEWHPFEIDTPIPDVRHRELQALIGGLRAAS